MTKKKPETEELINPDDLTTLQDADVPPGDLAADLAEPGTIAPPDETEALAESWPPTGLIMVYQDSHNAPAAILRINEDRTLDLVADLYGLGRDTILFGVHRRQGNGNGWEPGWESV